MLVSTMAIITTMTTIVITATPFILPFHNAIHIITAHVVITMMR